LGKTSRFVIVNNILLFTVMLSITIKLFNKIKGILVLIQLSNNTINEVDLSFSNITIYTNKGTYHIELYVLLSFIGIGLAFNITYYLYCYLKEKRMNMDT
jgi:hypothetical protein